MIQIIIVNKNIKISLIVINNFENIYIYRSSEKRD